MSEVKAVCGGFIVGEGLEMNGKVLSATGGAGDDAFFLITVTANEDGTMSCDKTIDELIEAYNSKKPMFVKAGMYYLPSVSTMFAEVPGMGSYGTFIFGGAECTSGFNLITSRSNKPIAVSISINIFGENLTVSKLTASSGFDSEYLDSSSGYKINTSAKNLIENYSGGDLIDFIEYKNNNYIGEWRVSSLTQNKIVLYRIDVNDSAETVVKTLVFDGENTKTGVYSEKVLT